jgi:YihY family inner membrane protein
VEQAMNSGGRVPETRLLGEGELSADHAWRALRRYGGWRLLRDAFLRFRSGDGFSHARALGLQLCLAAVPLLIALNGLASKLGDPQRAGRVVADTVLALTPGASESLVRQLLTEQGRTRDLGQVALSLGLLTAVVALTTAAGQIERGANRIYGVDQDRSAPQKYLRALVLTVVAGVPALVSFLLLVAGGAIGASMQRWDHLSTATTTTWNLLRWPMSLGLIVVTVSLLFRYAPRRQQPGLSWLMVGAGLATALWWLISLLLAAFVTQSSDFGATYGPLTGVMALLLWANLTGIALFLGIAFTAQLEARRARGSRPALPTSNSNLKNRPTSPVPAAADSSPRTLGRLSEAELEQLPGTGRGPAVPAGEDAGSRVWGGAQDGQDPRGGRGNPGGPGSLAGAG